MNERLNNMMIRFCGIQNPRRLSFDPEKNQFSIKLSWEEGERFTWSEQFHLTLITFEATTNRILNKPDKYHFPEISINESDDVILVLVKPELLERFVFERGPTEQLLKDIGFLVEPLRDYEAILDQESTNGIFR